MFSAFITEILLDKEATYIALGAAVRVATSLGLQQQLKDPRLSPPEVSERYIIFWCMYSLDKSLSLRLGRPPAIDDRDIEIDVPDERQLAVTNPRTAVLLLAHINLSRIASEVYSELYSARSRRYPALKRFRTISELDTKLQEWCRSLPVDVQPGKPLVCSKENVRHAITLHLEYFNCLATLHRCWAFQDQLTEYDELRHDMARQDCGDIGDRVYTGHMISFIILFANVIQNPGDSYITEDVQLLGVILDSLFPSLQASGTFLPNLVYEIFSKMRSMAAEYVEKVHVELKNVSKRPRRDSDEAVMHLPHRSAANNHVQPRNKGAISTADTHRTTARYNASLNLTEPASLTETGLPHELTSKDNAWKSLYDDLDDLPTDEMPSGQHPYHENYNMGFFAESLPGSVPFIPWSLDFDLTDLWQYGKQDLFEGRSRE
ncbi:hypothetical protein APSETT445_007495 [Aspergillus pseudonomiae]